MVEFIKNSLAALSERERRLIAISVVVLVVFIFFLVAFLVNGQLSDLRAENKKLQESLTLLAKEGPTHLERQRAAKSGQDWMSTKPTPLRTLVDKIGKQLEVTPSDIKELPDKPHGKYWIEHAAELSMREIGLLNLTKFMEQIESNRKRFPIAISKLEIRKRRRSEDVFTVKIVISTYERAPKAPKSKKGGN